MANNVASVCTGLENHIQIEKDNLVVMALRLLFHLFNLSNVGEFSWS